MKVVFVGLSNEVGKKPLCPTTPSGSVIQTIAEQLGATCYMTNLVQFAPLDSAGKLRYPNKEELREGVASFTEYVKELSPDKIVLLGSKVCNAVNLDNCVRLQHPAYAIRQGKIESYIKDSVQKIKE